VFDTWVGKIPQRREWLPTLVVLPEKFSLEGSYEKTLQELFRDK